MFYSRIDKIENMLLGLDKRLLNTVTIGQKVRSLNAKRLDDSIFTPAAYRQSLSLKYG